MKGKLVTAILIWSISAVTTKGQGLDLWLTLAKVTFKSQFDPATMIETKIPKISAAVEAIDGTEIEIEGYMIPLTGQIMQAHFMFSRYPQSTCFFCGKAGPESAMQVFMKDGKKVKITERKIKVRGTLYVNPKDANSLLYSLQEATIIE
jgi:hypothetical protein